MMKRTHRVAALAAATTMTAALALTGTAAQATTVMPQGGVTSCTTQYNVAVQQANDTYAKDKAAVEAKYAKVKVDSKAHVDREVAKLRANIDRLKSDLKTLQDNMLSMPWPEFEKKQQAYVDELGAAWANLKSETAKLKAAQKAQVSEAQKVRKAELASARDKRSNAINQARAFRSACNG